ncbi:MAG: type II secretion system inner membrane protein GspF [Deltaproteobacteria bacterium]|nr:type II secretion system inner membrane protein GspF [Deltaproteobacteria bacterium]
MPVYEYRALDAAGKSKKGIIDADTPRAARQRLRSQGLFPIEVTWTSVEKTSSGWRHLTWHRLSPKDVSAAIRQLATLVGSGLPLVESLNALIEQSDSPEMKRSCTQIKDRVVEGGTLADAMSSHPKMFSPLFINMVRAGEASGALEVVLNRLADFSESHLKLRNKIRATMAYPFFMLFVGLAVLFFLFTFVIPTVTGMFTEMKRALPLPTLILLQVAGFFRAFWWLLAAGLVGAFFWVRKMAQTPRWGLAIDRFMLRAPVFGGLVRKLIVTRVTRTLATLLASGIPLLTALAIVKAIVTNREIVGALDKTIQDIGEGSDLAGPLRKSGVFPPMVIHLVAAGEKSGQLEEMLNKIADAYEDDVETTVTSLTSILEPVMILLMGGIVLFIVVSILLPILEMTKLVK